MTTADRELWDGRHAGAPDAEITEVGPPPTFAPFEHLFPSEGSALEPACGRGHGAVWLAGRGLDVVGLDVSPVAIGHARELALLSGVADRCRFDVFDFDDGLPDGPPVDVVMVHLFWDPLLVGSLIGRLGPGGLLAVATLSEVDAEPGRFRMPRNGLTDVFAGVAELDAVAHGEGDGRAWYLGVRRSR